MIEIILDAKGRSYHGKMHKHIESNVFHIFRMKTVQNCRLFLPAADSKTEIVTILGKLFVFFCFFSFFFLPFFFFFF